MTYHKVGLLIEREGLILLCRKREGTQLLILPGGCIEPGESHEECLVREVREELGEVGVTDTRFLGTYEYAAAGGGSVRIELYAGTLCGAPQPCSEIAELVWFHPCRDDQTVLAPSIREAILPDLFARRLLGW